MQTESNDDNEPEVDPAVIELVRSKAEELETVAQKLGLYQQHGQIALDPEGRAVVMATFLIGDVAYSDRVQNPVADDTEDKFRAIESDIRKQEFIELQERLREQHGKGE